MTTKVLSIILLLLITSCSKNKEELNLLKYSDKYKDREIEIREIDFNKKDSQVIEKKYFKIFDTKNRLINKNNCTFYFYNTLNKVSQTKTIYRRGGTAVIIIYRYLYDKKGNLKVILSDITKKDTFQTFKYDLKNNIVEKKGNYLKYTYKYSKNKISMETEFENDTISKISNFIYDKKGNKIENNWVFNEDHKMKTYYIYNSKKLLISKRDSCIKVYGNPNEYVEFKTQYFYDAKDSLIEKRDFGRILSEKKFKYRGKTKYKYRIL